MMVCPEHPDAPESLDLQVCSKTFWTLLEYLLPGLDGLPGMPGQKGEPTRLELRAGRPGAPGFKGTLTVISHNLML